MLTAIVGLIAAVVTAFFGAFINEMYKRHRDACATAAALAGELASYSTAYDALDISLPILLKRAEAGRPLNIPQQDSAVDVTFQAYVDKLGLLGTKLAEETAYVYGQLRGFRSVFQSITRAPAEADSEYLAANLRVAHTFSQNAKRRGEPLIAELTELASTPFMSDLAQRLPWRRTSPASRSAA